MYAYFSFQQLISRILLKKYLIPDISMLPCSFIFRFLRKTEICFRLFVLAKWNAEKSYNLTSFSTRVTPPEHCTVIK